MYEKLFETNYIGTMELKNRLVVPAMSTRFVGEDGKATEQFAAYHEARAKGGWALLITENILIDQGVGVKKELPGLWCDEQIEGYREVTDRIHKAGGKICAQIYHAGRNTHSGITGIHNVGPSPICDPSNREVPYELTTLEIAKIEDQFAQAALRAKKAGFDAVEIHGAHGYLVAQFLSPFSNHRCDEYGGNLINRARFAVEITKKVKALTGDDYPVLFRISATEFIDQGINVEHAKAISRMLEAAGVDAINCSQSGPATFYNTVPSFYVPNGAFIELAAEIKKVVSVPVISVGRINDPQLAEEVLLSGKADLVAMGRASVADPNLPLKIKNGDLDSIQTCIGCCQGCLGSTIRKQTLTCLVNPFAGKETVYLPEDKAKIKKKAVIVGGGISGCEAAIIAAMRGHETVLYEKSAKLGGQWNAACVPNGKAEFASLVSWQKEMLKRCQVTVHMNTEITYEMLRKEQADVIFDATGSLPISFALPGLCESSMDIAFAQEILLGKKTMGHHPLIIGGGLVGAETAEFIAGYHVPVELAELRDAVAVDCEPGPKYFLLKSLKERGVMLHTSAAVKEIKGNDVRLERENDSIWIKNVDQIVFAAGVRPNSSFSKMIMEGDEGTSEKLMPKLIAIGDAAGAKNGLANMQEAFLAACEI